MLSQNYVVSTVAVARNQEMLGEPVVIEVTLTAEDQNRDPIALPGVLPLTEDVYRVRGGPGDGVVVWRVTPSQDALSATLTVTVTPNEDLDVQTSVVALFKGENFDTGIEVQITVDAVDRVPERLEALAEAGVDVLNQGLPGEAVMAAFTLGLRDNYQAPVAATVTLTATLEPAAGASLDFIDVADPQNFRIAGDSTPTRLVVSVTPAEGVDTTLTLTVSHADYSFSAQAQITVIAAVVARDLELRATSAMLTQATPEQEQVTTKFELRALDNMGRPIGVDMVAIAVTATLSVEGAASIELSDAPSRLSAASPAIIELTLSQFIGVDTTLTLTARLENEVGEALVATISVPVDAAEARRAATLNVIAMDSIRQSTDGRVIVTFDLSVYDNYGILWEKAVTVNLAADSSDARTPPSVASVFDIPPGGAQVEVSVLSIAAVGVDTTLVLTASGDGFEDASAHVRIDALFAESRTRFATLIPDGSAETTNRQTQILDSGDVTLESATSVYAFSIGDDAGALSTIVEGLALSVTLINSIREQEIGAFSFILRSIDADAPESARVNDLLMTVEGSRADGNIILRAVFDPPLVISSATVNYEIVAYYSDNGGEQYYLDVIYPGTRLSDGGQFELAMKAEDLQLSSRGAGLVVGEVVHPYIITQEVVGRGLHLRTLAVRGSAPDPIDEPLDSRNSRASHFKYLVTGDSYPDLVVTYTFLDRHGNVDVDGMANPHPDFLALEITHIAAASYDVAVSEFTSSSFVVSGAELAAVEVFRERPDLIDWKLNARYFETRSPTRSHAFVEPIFVVTVEATHIALDNLNLDTPLSHGLPSRLGFDMRFLGIDDRVDLSISSTAQVSVTPSASCTSSASAAACNVAFSDVDRQGVTLTPTLVDPRSVGSTLSIAISVDGYPEINVRAADVSGANGFRIAPPPSAEVSVSAQYFDPRVEMDGPAVVIARVQISNPASTDSRYIAQTLRIQGLQIALASDDGVDLADLSFAVGMSTASAGSTATSVTIAGFDESVVAGASVELELTVRYNDGLANGATFRYSDLSLIYSFDDASDASALRELGEVAHSPVAGGVATIEVISALARLELQATASTLTQDIPERPTLTARFELRALDNLGDAIVIEAAAITLTASLSVEGAATFTLPEAPSALGVTPSVIEMTLSGFSGEDFDLTLEAALATDAGDILLAAASVRVDAAEARRAATLILVADAPTLRQNAIAEAVTATFSLGIEDNYNDIWLQPTTVTLSAISSDGQAPVFEPIFLRPNGGGGIQVSVTPAVGVDTTLTLTANLAGAEDVSVSVQIVAALAPAELATLLLNGEEALSLNETAAGEPVTVSLRLTGLDQYAQPSAVNAVTVCGHGHGRRHGRRGRGCIRRQSGGDADIDDHPGRGARHGGDADGYGRLDCDRLGDGRGDDRRHRGGAGAGGAGDAAPERRRGAFAVAESDDRGRDGDGVADADGAGSVRPAVCRERGGGRGDGHGWRHGRRGRGCIRRQSGGDADFDDHLGRGARHGGDVDGCGRLDGDRFGDGCGDDRRRRGGGAGDAAA